MGIMAANKMMMQVPDEGIAVRRGVYNIKTKKI